MTFERWHPLTELEGMRREMDRICQELIPSSRIFTPASTGVARPERGVARPTVDIMDRIGEVVIKADMPGVDKEDIDISVQEDTLILKGTVKNEEGPQDENFVYSERNRRPYARAIELPVKIDAGNIRATLKEGVLTIHLPKAKEHEPKKIKIDVSEGAGH
jgi:HSP20 family protein